MLYEDFVPIKQKQVAKHRGHGKKSLTAVISKSVFSGFEKPHRLYYKSDYLLLSINKKYKKQSIFVWEYF